MTDGHKYTFQGFDGPYWRAKEAAEREDLKKYRKGKKEHYKQLAFWDDVEIVEDRDAPQGSYYFLNENMIVQVPGQETLDWDVT